MLYWIYELTSINILQDITVRAGISFFVAFILTLILIPKFIKWTKNKNIIQPIHDMMPESHQKKLDIPAMGGLVFLSSTIFATILCVRLDNIFVIGGFLAIILFSLIGIKDDLLKMKYGNNLLGLSRQTKFLLQIFSAFIVAIFIFFISDISSELFVPFLKNPVIQMEYFAIFFWVLVIVSVSNAVNLTDGLDGLATVPSIFSMLTLGIFLYISGDAVLSNNLGLPKVSGAGEIVIMATAFIGALTAFLWHNCHPAKIFMGEVGSMGIGAFIAYMAIVSKNELLLIIVGFLFLIETVSTILQLGSFKIFGKTIFKMAPIHHHFEKEGWAESKIVVRFWIIALVSNLIALMEIKLG
ncbi:MAG: phospho-N-acetylmuramoyl-pentapeptide-transferase [Sulfurospirillum sp.]|nr:phospho-N-acetylmuramoyl-pentapeptide-transferase [Sulfurospirillum sp.]MBL0702433.1 phospho-N-acetylmuramoyl-pentapeptide-transferase [Sulfurospirillum sp.]